MRASNTGYPPAPACLREWRAGRRPWITLHHIVHRENPEFKNTPENAQNHPHKSAKSHYVFTIYALDVAKLAVSGDFACRDALKAMEGHILDRAVLTGTYTLNPKLAP